MKDVQEDGTFLNTMISFEELWENYIDIRTIRGSAAPDMETAQSRFTSG